MELILNLEPQDYNKLKKIAEAKNSNKEDIAKTMIETMIIWLEEKFPNELG